MKVNYLKQVVASDKMKWEKIIRRGRERGKKKEGGTHLCGFYKMEREEIPSYFLNLETFNTYLNDTESKAFSKSKKRNQWQIMPRQSPALYISSFFVSLFHGSKVSCIFINIVKHGITKIKYLHSFIHLFQCTL